MMDVMKKLSNRWDDKQNDHASGIQKAKRLNLALNNVNLCQTNYESAPQPMKDFWAEQLKLAIQGVQKVQTGTV